MKRCLHCIPAVFLCLLLLSCLSALVEGPPAEKVVPSHPIECAIVLLPALPTNPDCAAEHKNEERNIQKVDRISLPRVTTTCDRNGSPVVALPYFRTVYQAFPPEKLPRQRFVRGC